MAKIEAANAHHVANCLIVACQLGSRGEVESGYVVSKSDAQRSGRRLIGMIEVPAVVAAEHPKLRGLMERRIGP
jgi:hypothetical protein